MEIFTGTPLQTSSSTVGVRRESEPLLSFSEKPHTLIITTFTPFCHSDHTDAFFSSCAREKRMNSSQWVPSPRRIWRYRTDFSSRASQNLFPHPALKVAQQKVVKGWKRTFPCHRCTNMVLELFFMCYGSRLSLLYLPLPGQPGFWRYRWQGVKAPARAGGDKPWWLAGWRATLRAFRRSLCHPPRTAALAPSRRLSPSPTHSWVD